MKREAFEPPVFEKLITKAVKAMKNEGIDAGTIEEVESMGICSEILGKSNIRRLETSAFLKDVASKIANDHKSLKALEKCYNYIEK